MAIDYIRGSYASIYTTAVDKILALDGTKVSAEFQRIRDGHKHTWTERENTGNQAVLDAILTGKRDMISAAIRDWQIRQNSIVELANDLDGPVYKALRDAYQATAKHNYTTIAAAFDSTAQTLRDHAEAVTLGAHADAIVTLDEPARQAWLDAPRTAAKLETLAEALALAAEVAGIHYTAPDVRGNQAIRALTIDPDELRDSDTWAHLDKAQNGGHRAGFWGAATEMGVNVRATRYDAIAPVGKPAEKQLVQEWVSIGAGIHGVRQSWQ